MLSVEDYTIIAGWFPRLLGLIYFFTFGAFAIQIKGLLGKNGILPITHYLNAIKSSYGQKAYYLVPTVFWINSSDKALMGVTLGGTALSLLLLGGVYPPVMLLLCYILYLSIVSAGQDFLSFGWEGFLLEVTANAFLLSLTTVPNIFVWISINFLLFRFHVQAGAVKFQSRDPSWKNQTAIAYHYQTQPLPNTTAWYFYRLPLWFHRLSCVMMFGAELVVPFGIFGGETVRLLTFIGLFGLQFFIWFTGNLSFLNHLTAVFCTILLNNGILEAAGFVAPPSTETSLWLESTLSCAGAFLLALQIARLYDHFFQMNKVHRFLGYFNPFHIVNRYGIFAVMTTKRYEIIVEGSNDRKEWKEYTFRYKPSEITRRPKRVSPYQPRIDWQMWFLPFTRYESALWFQLFLVHLLKGTKEVLKLIRDNPFPDAPPLYIRAVAYDYVFSTQEEKKQHGWWWKRTFAGTYSPILTLKAEESHEE